MAVIGSAFSTAVQRAVGATQARSISVTSCWSGIKVTTSIIGRCRTDGGSPNVQFTPCDSEQIVESLKNRECDVGIVRDSLVPNAAKELGSGFDMVPVGRLVLCVAVNTKSSAHAMTLGGWRCFSGRAANGAEIEKGGMSPRIELFGTSRFSAGKRYFPKGGHAQRGPWAKELVDEMPPGASHEKDSGDAVIGAIIKDPRAIGFFTLGDRNVLDNRIRVLAIARGTSNPRQPCRHWRRSTTVPIRLRTD